jgi:hypothetical protein
MSFKSVPQGMTKRDGKEEERRKLAVRRDLDKVP